ncbi:MAG: DNA/RNA non-specific endonuclease [Lactobacillus sp.]|nr:DNA/RNA non-specific endonuclease [Lactobacillus sp.]MCI2033283.1 DNA/RNA non-specific endonuclease [Lactobacillus sp.]
MLILGLIVLLAGIVLLLGKAPRAKRARTRRRKQAASLIAIGLALAGGQQVQQKVSGPTTQAPAKTTHNTAQPVTKLAQLTYNGDQELTINNNDPAFSEADLKTTNGAWTRFSDLDTHNRVGVAEAMLNQRLMPTQERQPLTWSPTGWHNKRLRGGWLYNRSHLIGFQLSGENNNPKNLMTGTRELNSPLMQAHEDDIAHYLKQDAKHFVRYEVTPVFRGDELLARGVAMRAQSIGDNTIRFNVYIFNVQPGVTLNYADGTSRLQ